MDKCPDCQAELKQVPMASGLNYVYECSGCKERWHTLHGGFTRDIKPIDLDKIIHPWHYED